jgi:hypothetical protein
MPRTKLPDDTSRSCLVSAKLDLGERLVLDAYCKEYALTRSAAIRQILRSHLRHRFPRKPSSRPPLPKYARV